MRLGTLLWTPPGEGHSGGERRALVAPLPSDPTRGVDLNRVERQRLAKLGEGVPETLAEVLVPPSLERVLEGGPRALQRVRQALAYAEKWERRSGLPESLAPRLDTGSLLPCVSRARAIRRWDGSELDPGGFRGRGAVLGQWPLPTLALLGMAGGVPAGCCLALDDVLGGVLGSWLEVDPDWAGSLELQAEGQTWGMPLDSYCGLALPPLEAGEILLAPPSRLGAPHALGGSRSVRLIAPFEALDLELEGTLLHPTLQ